MVLQAQETLLLQLLQLQFHSTVLRQERQEGDRAPRDGGVEEDQEGGGGGRVRCQHLVQGHDRGLLAPNFSRGNLSKYFLDGPGRLWQETRL